ncbi:MAG: oligosaccharide flippase family protein, partial [Balneolales bacterium]
GEHTLNYFGSKVDYLLIGRFLGADVLGLYMLAYELVLVPLKRINPILTRVAFPVFSQKQQNSPALRTGYVELSKLLGVLVFPFMACMGVLAPLFVPIVFGPGWEQAIPLIQILALTGLIKAMGNPSGSIILALGRADLSFYWNLFTAIFTSVVFWFAVQYGVYALAMAYLLISVLYFAAGQELLINRLIHLSWPEYLKVFLYPLIISMLMSVIIYSGYLYFTSTQMLEVVSLAVLIVLSLLVYLPGIWFSERKFLSGLAGIIFNKS